VDGTFELPTFTHQVSAETISEGELIQCTEQGQDSVAAWFTLQTRVRPVVSVTVQGLFAKQYQYGLNLSGSEPPWFGASPVTRSFDVVAEELCFQVQGRSYLDEEITKIGEQCVSLEGLGVAVLDEMSGDLRQTLLGCVVPPDGFADDWCALFEAAFAAESCDGFPLDSCFAARRGCSAGDQPSSSQEQDEREDREVPVGVGGTPGAGGFTAAGGGGFESGIGGSPDMRDNGDGPTSHASGGCNIVTMRPFSHAGWLLLIMPLLIGRRLRRF
jgi:hypothetical protein